MYDPYWHYFEYLRQEIEKIREENKSLRKQIEELKPIHIDKMVYKIQELNIETLSGMLNLGMSLNGDGENMTELAEKIVNEEGVSVDFGQKKEQVNSPLPDNDVFHDSKAKQQWKNTQDPPQG
ncbi:spore germination protein GerPC [Shimazuella sp. AN120528]|uniref:spore germination protein GerPC n=1 Tax=Shimazuella soli TaxID=1892854 RepID=UPI001F0E5E25|nr:spore germination protein GerPC [Shimazuella soli]MCH5586557.1 spore germination protein GerPC [Shimazuella soli]